MIGNKNFIQFVEQLEKDEEFKLEEFEVGKDKVVIQTIVPDPKKLGRDVTLPVLSPILVRKKSLEQEVAELIVPAPAKPLPMKETDREAAVFHYEGYDLIEMKKIVERDYKIPAPQTADEVIGYYARRIAEDVKLPSQFALIAPKVREFLTASAFGKTVDINTPQMVKAIASNVATFVTITAFVTALRKVVVEDREPELIHAGRRLSELHGFPWSRPTLAATWPYHERALILLNKPAGYECSQKPKHHPSVMSLLPAPLRQRGVQPVGRLDADTTGLLLLTDDGALIHRWTSPKRHVPKVYEVGTAAPVTADQIAAFACRCRAAG